MSLSKNDIERLFELLNEELSSHKEKGEIFLLGGAIMCLIYAARPATKDIDAFFKPTSAIRAAARRVALKADLPEDWLNDAVKGYMSENGDFMPYLELSNLRIMTATPEYLLAMKSLAMRIGKEFHDEADVRFLLRYLGIESYQKALEVIGGYYPIERFPQKTLYALEEILSDSKRG